MSIKNLKARLEQLEKENKEIKLNLGIVSSNEVKFCCDCGAKLPKDLKNRCYDCYNELYFPGMY